MVEREQECGLQKVVKFWKLYIDSKEIPRWDDLLTKPYFQ